MSWRTVGWSWARRTESFSINRPSWVPATWPPKALLVVSTPPGTIMGWATGRSSASRTEASRCSRVMAPGFRGPSAGWRVMAVSSAWRSSGSRCWAPTVPSWSRSASWVPATCPPKADSAVRAVPAILAGSMAASGARLSSRSMVGAGAVMSVGGRSMTASRFVSRCSRVMAPGCRGPSLGWVVVAIAMAWRSSGSRCWAPTTPS